jgi:hypothetical protein
MDLFSRLEKRRGVKGFASDNSFGEQALAQQGLG